MPNRSATIRERIARWIAPAPAAPASTARRAYAAARNTRTTGGFGAGGSTSADAELTHSLGSLRARSRQMVRDSAYAKRAQLVVVNNVIGTGVGMQAQISTTRGTAADRVNDAIETAWAQWGTADSCHTGGALHFHDIERACMAQVFEAGEVFVRLHYTAFGASRVRLALEIIEPERIATELVEPGAMANAGPTHTTRMGVEVDTFGRAVAYWIRRYHPGDVHAGGAGTDRYERVPAADIYHLRITERWPQTRGVPWLHTVLRKLDDLNEYSQLEVSAARASAAYFATIESPEGDNPLSGSDEEPPIMDIEPLMIQQLEPGQKLEFHAPNRPNAGLDPFMRAMLREVAAGCGASYESLSRDYSQSNYSSSRLSLLDDRDLYRTLQQWWIRSFRRPLHAVWLQQAVLSRAVESISVDQYAAAPERYAAATFKPRGWSWVDPTKEVNAYKEAIRAGITTLTDVIAQTGGGLDIEDVIKTRRRELDMLSEAGIEVDTTTPEVVATEPAPEPEEPAAAPTSRRVVPIARTA